MVQNASTPASIVDNLQADIKKEIDATDFRALSDPWNSKVVAVAMPTCCCFFLHNIKQEAASKKQEGDQPAAPQAQILFPVWMWLLDIAPSTS